MSRKALLRERDKFEARQFREVGMPIHECAKYFRVSVPTMVRGLADMRAKLGPEKLPPRGRNRLGHRVILAIDQVERASDRHENLEGN